MASTHFDNDSALLVIDVQQRLMGSMPDERMKRCLHATTTMVELAADTGASIVYTEQYPDGLGPTESSLLEHLKTHDAGRVEKVRFDACTADAFEPYLIELPRRIVVCGMETHICVYATVRELLEHNHEVIVPLDCVISRRDPHRENGLQMMRELGATITNYETVVFDTLKTSKHPAFKKFSKMVR